MTLDQPNILCIVSEDCPPRLGAYGDPLAQTPQLDKLAREGVTWNVACCTSPVCAPSRFAILTGRYAESVPTLQHMTSFGPLPQGITTYPEMMRAAGYYCTNNAKTHYNCDVDPAALWDETSTTAHWHKRPPGTPFLAVFNTMITHESCVFQDQPGRVAPEDVTLPSHLPDTEGMRVSLARYYNAIERMDDFMGERLKELDDAGERDNTIVFYYSDHASPLPRSKRFCYDDGLRVPLIVRVPERWKHLLPLEPGSWVDAPVSLVDLMATFAAIAGCETPASNQGQPLMGKARVARPSIFSGRDRMDEHYDLTRTVRTTRYRYIRNYAPHRIWAQHYAFAWISPAYQDYEQRYLDGKLDLRQRRFWQRKPAEELYDMAADPDATENLASLPDYQGVLEELRRALDAHMLRIHDCGFIPEGSAADTWQASRDSEVYPLEKVLDLAARAIKRDASELPGFIRDLSHPSLVMRYWAAQGLLMLAVEGVRLPEGIEEVLEAEDDPFVQIPLAEALGHSVSPRAQVRRLTNVVAQETHPRLRLQALNALHYLPLFPDISLEAARYAAEDEDEYVRGAAAYLALKLDKSYRPDSKIFRFDLFRATGHSGLPNQSFPRLRP